MKKLSLAAMVLMLALTACQQPAAPVKDGVCSTQGAAGVPAMIDPDCPTAAK
jgi:hypothetical protein